VRKERGLSVPRQSELLCGPLETKPAQVSAKCSVNFPKNAARDGKCFGQVLSHPGLL